jgi:ribosomal protein S18 acetylase RimI-like enzyme
MTNRQLTLDVEANPSTQEIAALEQRINDHNVAVTGFDDYKPLAIFIRDELGVVTAGVTGFSWGGGCRITALWVDENLRKQGIGAALLGTAEEEARKRGCRVVVLETHGFQAPDFYRKLGYTEAGFRPDYPIGDGEYFFFKQLTPETST